MSCGFPAERRGSSPTSGRREEVDFIISGDAIFTVDGDDVEVAAGDYLRVDPLSGRIFLAGGDGVRILVVGARKPEVYDGRATL